MASFNKYAGLLLVMALPSWSQAVLINGSVEIDFVNIDGANAADTDADVNRKGYGAVGYDYMMSQNEISYGQFAASGISNGNEDHWVNDLGTDAPVVQISFHMAARYCNWLTTGKENEGAYSIDGFGNVNGMMTRRNILDDGGVFYLLPTEDEWYKAAYYHDGSYNFYATPSGSAPVDHAGAIFLSSNTTPWTVTSGAPEFNGTYNMMGNVYEWTETAFGGAFEPGIITNDIAFRGGDYNQGLGKLDAGDRQSDIPGTNNEINIGMRIAVVPEPGTISLMGMSMLGVFFVRTIRRRRNKIHHSSVREVVFCGPFCTRHERLASSSSEDHIDCLKKSIHYLYGIFSGLFGKSVNYMRSLDKGFWNWMVVRQEQKIERRRGRLSLKSRGIHLLDEILDKIMK